MTGTNGKTTTAFLIRELLEAAGRQTGLLGTVKSVIGGNEREVQRTTPEAIDLQRTFREMLDAGDRACSIEVSSHALELHRADAVHFAAAIFTNLTQDHLDFHETMEDYFRAKQRLFEAGPGVAGDQRRRSIWRAACGHGREAGHVRARPRRHYRAIDVETGLSGSRFTVVVGDDARRGRLAAARQVQRLQRARRARHRAPRSGSTWRRSPRAIEHAGQVPGRFEPVDEGQGFAVLVDYAHTPDSLENVLAAARTLTDGRVHVVFGCGGDRDRGKRPLMGEIATRLADRVIVTSDNPRSEDPDAIIAEVLEGAGSDVRAQVDRRSAIAEAIAGAAAGDVVVIAGKGHEQGQEFSGGHKIPFDDVTVAREVLRSAALTR